MRRNNNLIRLALLLALGIHCLFLLVAWKFYELPPEFVEPPLEISVEFEEPEPIPEEPEEVIEQPEPIPEEPEEVIEEPEPIPEEPEEVIEQPEPIPEEPEEVIEEPEPIPEEPEEIIEEPEPIPEELEKVVAETELIPEEMEELFAGSEFFSEGMEDLIIEPEFVSEGPEGFVAKTDFISREKTLEKNSVTELEGEGKPSGETVSNVEKSGSSSQGQNKIAKPQFPESYLQTVIKKIISAKRYPRFARDRGIEGKVLMEFIISGNGELQEVKVADSSGYSILDQEAVKTLQRATPFPPIPGKEEADLVTMRIAIAFELES